MVTVELFAYGDLTWASMAARYVMGYGLVYSPVFAYINLTRTLMATRCLTGLFYKISTYFHGEKILKKCLK